MDWFKLTIAVLILSAIYPPFFGFIAGIALFFTISFVIYKILGG